MKYIKLFLVFLLSVAGVLCGKTTPCEDNWVAFNGSCYLVGHDKFHFIEAQRFCEHLNAYLVHINDVVETTFLTSYLDFTYWTGLTDGVTEGIWRWSDTDTVATYFNWYPGEPNNGKVGNCIALRYDLNFKWIDDPCSNLFKPVCEKRPTTDTEIIG